MKTSLLISFMTSIIAASAAAPGLVTSEPADTNATRNAPGAFSRTPTTFQSPVAPTIPVAGTFSRPQTTFSIQSGTFSRPEGTFSRPEGGTFERRPQGTFERLETTFDRPQTTFSRPPGTFSPLESTFNRPGSTFEQPLVAASSGTATIISIPPVVAIPQPAAAPKVVVLDLPPGAVIRKPASSE